ncbi:sensory rhodopsin transducer [Nonomuraea sp. NPDC002799]
MPPRPTGIGSTTWVVADGYIPPRSSGPEPEMTSHDSICMLNPGDTEARVEVHVYFTDREPAGPFLLAIAPRRAFHQRINDLENPERIPIGTDYCLVVTSDVPIVVQHTRLDSRQEANALMSTIAFPA